MPVIKVVDLEEAHHRWCSHFGFEMNSHYLDLGLSFSEAAGIKDKDITWAPPHIGTLVNVPEKCARLVSMLLSPHWETLLKAHEIRNKELKHDMGTGWAI